MERSIVDDVEKARARAREVEERCDREKQEIEQRHLERLDAESK